MIITGGGRFAFGCSILINLMVYNELSASCIVVSTMFAFALSILMERFRKTERLLPISYIRASNKFDFTCLFLSTWLETLAILCSCVILARTISVCFDVLTGGLARISILGRNAQENEPWPDVLGVGVVFVLTTMFMLGLEHTLVFSGIMFFGVCGLTLLLLLMAWSNGNTAQWVENLYLRKNSKNFFRTSALIGFSFSSDIFIHSTIRLSKYFIWTCLACFLALTTLSISALVQNRIPKEYIAAPFFNIIIENGFNKLLPMAACFLMLTATGAFLELFPQLYGMIVKLSSSDWKVLSKQISYESTSSGNPVLAVFIAGSLCAMLVFSCPLQDLCYTLAASHLSSDFLRIFYFLYIPFRPTFMEQNNVESAMTYSRLSSESCRPSRYRYNRIKWNLVLQGQRRSSSGRKNVRKEVEKEWLLLGEPTSPTPLEKNNVRQSSTIISNVDQDSDFSELDRQNDTESDSSTDIDAIVDEYKQKIKVTTAGHSDRSPHVPSLISWRITVITLIVISMAIGATLTSYYMQCTLCMITGYILMSVMSILMNIIPSHINNAKKFNPTLCCHIILIIVVLFSACARNSWMAIVIWIFGGLLMLLRCENVCCDCSDDELLFDDDSINNLSIGKSTPPKIIIPLPPLINERS